MNRAARLGAALILSLLAGCGGGGDWTKAGGDEAAAAREYQGCRALAGTVVNTRPISIRISSPPATMTGNGLASCGSKRRTCAPRRAIGP